MSTFVKILIGFVLGVAFVVFSRKGHMDFPMEKPVASSEPERVIQAFELSDVLRRAKISDHKKRQIRNYPPQRQKFRQERQTAGDQIGARAEQEHMRKADQLAQKEFVHEQSQQKPHGKRRRIQIKGRMAVNHVSDHVEKRDAQKVWPQSRFKRALTTFIHILGKVAREEHKALHDENIDRDVDHASPGILAELPPHARKMRYRYRPHAEAAENIK